MVKEDLMVITDIASGRSQNKVLEKIVGRVSGEGIGWNLSGPIKRLSETELELMREISKNCVSEQEFMENFNSVKAGFNTGEVLKYAEKTNPALYKRLSSGMPAIEALWLTYQESLKGKKFDSNINYSACVDEASKTGFPNILEVLFDHNVIALDFGRAGNIPYHMIGRGFVAEGCKWPLYNKENKDTGKKIILLPLGLYDGQETQSACAEELINHEIVGHSLSQLTDHSASQVRPEDCIMSIPFSREQFVELAKARRGLVFCKGCKEKYENARRAE